MTTIYLIRHAEAEGNLFKRLHGQYDSPVTPLGQQQIACLARRFADIPVDAVYSSDLKRTRQTAQSIFQTRNLPLHPEPALREVHLGDMEDLPFGAIMRTRMEELGRCSGGDPEFFAPGGERLGDVRDRVLKALKTIAAAHPNQTVAVFCHGTAIRLVQTAISGSEHYFPEGINTAVTCLEWDGADLKIKWYNDTSHLTAEVAAAAVRPDDGHQKYIPGQVPAQLLWFRRWNPETELEYYMNCRREGWLERFCPDVFSSAVLAHSARHPDAVRVAMSRETPAGILELDFEKGADEGVGAIPFYYVDEAHRRHGIGVQLLGEAISIYRAMGRTRLRLRCAPENTTALRFYTRHGFYQIGMAEDSAVPLFQMERPIG